MGAKLVKIIQCRINGFDGLQCNKDIDSSDKKKNKEWKKSWDSNMELIDQAIKDFVMAKNKTITYLFSEYLKMDTFVKERKAQGEKISFSEAWKKLHGGKKREASCYAVMTSNLKGYQAANASESNRRLGTAFDQAIKKGLLYGKVSLPSFRESAALEFRGSSVKVGIDNIGGRDSYYISLALKKGVWIHANLGIPEKDGNTKAVLKRIIDGIYTAGTAQIVKKNNKTFIQLTYKFDREDAMKYGGLAGLQNNLDPMRVLGVDLGLAKPLVMQPYDAGKEEYIISDKYANTSQFMDKWCINEDRINNFRKQIEKKKFRKQHNLREVSEGHSGKGRIKRTAPLDVYKDKISNFRKTTNHVYAKRIIDTAIKYGCGTIQLEDLGGLNKTDAFLGKWTYFDLHKRIEEKAACVGIEVKYVKPAYTSQRCSKCGNIDSENRPSQAVFVCKECGYKLNADVNAARNIALPDIENRIKVSLKKKK